MRRACFESFSRNGLGVMRFSVDQARTTKLAAQAGLDEARKKMEQAEKEVGDLISLRAKRDAAQAALGKAELDLSLLRARPVRRARRQPAHRLGAFVTPGPTPVCFRLPLSYEPRIQALPGVKHVAIST